MALQSHATLNRTQPSPCHLRLLPPYQKPTAGPKTPRDQLTSFLLAVDLSNGKIKRAQTQLDRMLGIQKNSNGAPMIEELKTFLESEIAKHTHELEEATKELAANKELLKKHLTEFPILMDEIPALRAEYFPETVVAPPATPEIILRPRTLQQGLLFPEDNAETPVTEFPVIPLKAASRAAPKKKDPAPPAQRPYGEGTFLLNSDPERAAERREERRRQRSGED